LVTWSGLGHFHRCEQLPGLALGAQPDFTSETIITNDDFRGLLELRCRDEAALSKLMTTELQQL
jgi:hypothetical protein